MTASDLIAALDAMADAPGGVKQLREAVLQLAVRGRLVPQDRREEPAAALLARVRHERRKLLKATIRERAGVLPCELPTGWSATTFDELGAFVGGKTPSKRTPRYWGGSIPWVSPKDMKALDIHGTEDHVTKAALRDGLAQVPVGAVLIVVRSGILRRTVPVAVARVRCTVNQDLKALCPCPSVMPEYIRLMIMGFERVILSQLTKTGTTVESMKFDEFAGQQFPFPPIAEQQRIITRVGELMSLVDRLEAAGSIRDDVRRAARDAALAALRHADTGEAVETAWQRISGHMDAMLTNHEDVTALRRTVLGLAVRGRLAEQSETEEPGAQIVRAAMTKRQERSGRWTPLARPTAAEIPFAAPRGWTWARLDDLCAIVGGVTKGRNLDGRHVQAFPYLRVANVQAGFLDLSVIKFIELPVEELDAYRLREGDVLLTEGGDWDKLGRSAIWRGEVADCIHQNHVFRARPLVCGVTSPWLSYFSNSADGRAYFQSCSKQTTNLASINMRQLKNCPVPLPPEGEQRRIVAKVETLMAMCDDLDTRVTAANELHGQMAAASIRDMDI